MEAVNPHENAADLWSDRNRTIATYINRGSRVIDLGSGAQSLKRYLRPGCTYTPADVVPRNGALLFDMEQDIYPEGEWDVAVLSGVLEYATDPARVLSRVSALAPRLLVSYAHDGSYDYRVRQQWRNHLSRAGLEQIIGQSYSRFRSVARWGSQHVYRAVK